MERIVEFFLNNKKFTIVLMVFVAVYGIIGIFKLNAESFPAVDFAMSSIVTRYDGASAEVVESKITKPIEDEIRSVSGIKDVRSTSQSGLSTIFVRGDIDNVKDINKLMADIQRSVDRARLPTDLKDPPEFTEIKSAEFPVLELAVVGSNNNRQRDIVADLLKEDIEDNKNILSVRPVGYRERTFEIFLDPLKMREQYIGINEVEAAIATRNVDVPGGHLEEGDHQQLLRVDGKVQNKKDIENIVVRSNASGQVVYLRDIARVEDGQEKPRIYTRYNGEEATLLVATKKAGADTIKLATEVDHKVDVFRKRYKDSLKFYVYNNEAKEVSNRVSILAGNAVSGLVLVIVFLLIFLPGRIGIMASLSLPFAILATLGMMPGAGMNIDAITILALVIAIGMLVDNSVVISENYARLLQDGLSPREAMLSSIRTLWLPITITVLTTISAFLPMLVTKGIMGKFIQWIPIVVSFSLAASLFESFFFLPSRLEGVSVRNQKKGPDWFQRGFISRFEKFMRVSIRHRYLTFVGFGLLLGVSIFITAAFNKFKLFPADETKMYISRVTLPKGSRLEATHEVMRKLSAEIKAKLGERAAHIVARSGTAQAGPADPKAKDSADAGMIIIYVDNDTRYNVPHTEILAKLREIEFPEAKITFEAQVNGPPVGEPVNATFRSNNADELDAALQEVKQALQNTNGIIDVEIQDTFAEDEVFVDIDYQKADIQGLNVNTIGNSIRTAISGRKINDVTLNNKDVELFLRFDADFRENVSDLNNLKVIGRNGLLVPLASFASFHVEPGTPHIKRFDYKRSRTLTANIEESKGMTAVVANQVVKDTYAKIKEKYKDISLVFGGEEESTKESMQSLMQAMLLALIGIAALLVFLLNSFLKPVIIMMSIPLGFVGVSISFALHDRPLSFLAMIGVVGLAGIIVNSGIVLITFIEELRAEGKLDLNEILVKASGLRFRAVVVSSLTTISGLLPTAYGIGGSDAMLVPMTLAMAWGLTTGTILTLVWIPSAYAILEDMNGFFARRLGKSENRPNGTNSKRHADANDRSAQTETIAPSTPL